MNPWAESLSFSLLRVIFCFFFLFFLLRILRYYMPMILSLFNTTRNPFGRAHTVGYGGIQSWHRSKKRCRLDRYEEKARSIENVCIRPSVRGMPFSLPNFHFYEYFLSPSWLQAKKKKKARSKEKGQRRKRIQDEIYRTYWHFFFLDAGNKHQEKMSTDYNEYENQWMVIDLFCISWWLFWIARSCCLPSSMLDCVNVGWLLCCIRTRLLWCNGKLAMASGHGRKIKWRSIQSDNRYKKKRRNKRKGGRIQVLRNNWVCIPLPSPRRRRSPCCCSAFPLADPLLRPLPVPSDWAAADRTTRRLTWSSSSSSVLLLSSTVEASSCWSSANSSLSSSRSWAAAKTTAPTTNSKNSVHFMFTFFFPLVFFPFWEEVCCGFIGDPAQKKLVLVFLLSG